MEPASVVLRTAGEAWRRDEARTCVARWRGEVAATWTALASRHRALASDEARMLLIRAASELDADSLGALRAHVARACAEQALAPTRDGLALRTTSPVTVEGRAESAPAAAARLATEAHPARRQGLLVVLSVLAEASLPTLRAARARADEAAGDVLAEGPPRPDRGPDQDALVKEASEFLRATRDAGEEALRVVRRGRSGGGDAVALALELAGGAERGHFTDRSRWKRCGAVVARAGLQRELAARVRVEPPHGALDLRGRVVSVEVPGDVRVSPSGVDHGLLSELAALDVLGRALALSLAQPAYPVELARPLDATVARTTGALFAHLLGEPQHWRRSDLSPAAREFARRTAACAVVLDVRLAAAALVLRRQGPHGLDAMTDALSDHLGVRVERAFVPLLVLTPAAVAARYRARRAALALVAPLRDRLDEDWFANPRFADMLRAAAQRAGSLSTEVWLTEHEVQEPGVAAGRRVSDLLA